MWVCVKKAVRHLSNVIHHGPIKVSPRFRQLGVSFCPRERSPKIQEGDAFGSGNGLQVSDLLRIS